MHHRSTVRTCVFSLSCFMLQHFAVVSIISNWSLIIVVESFWSFEFRVIWWGCKVATMHCDWQVWSDDVVLGSVSPPVCTVTLCSYSDFAIWHHRIYYWPHPLNSLLGTCYWFCTTLYIIYFTAVNRDSLQLYMFSSAMFVMMLQCMLALQHFINDFSLLLLPSRANRAVHMWLISGVIIKIAYLNGQRHWVYALKFAALWNRVWGEVCCVWHHIIISSSSSSSTRPRLAVKVLDAHQYFRCLI